MGLAVNLCCIAWALKVSWAAVNLGSSYQSAYANNQQVTSLCIDDLGEIAHYLHAAWTT